MEANTPVLVFNHTREIIAEHPDRFSFFKFPGGSYVIETNIGPYDLRVDLDNGDENVGSIVVSTSNPVFESGIQEYRVNFKVWSKEMYEERSKNLPSDLNFERKFVEVGGKLVHVTDVNCQPESMFDRIPTELVLKALIENSPNKIPDELPSLDKLNN